MYVLTAKGFPSKTVESLATAKGLARAFTATHKVSVSIKRAKIVTADEAAKEQQVAHDQEQAAHIDEYGNDHSATNAVLPDSEQDHYGQSLFQTPGFVGIPLDEV